MKLTLLGLLALMLAGCTVAPVKLTAEECIAFGVQAEGEPTGVVVSSEFKGTDGVWRECRGTHIGCAKGVSGGFPDPDHKYRVIYSDPQCVPYHEMCHALFETKTHTRSFVIRQIQGDFMAACPPRHIRKQVKARQKG